MDQIEVRLCHLRRDRFGKMDYGGIGQTVISFKVISNAGFLSEDGDIDITLDGHSRS